jgi:hypothetical protein
MMTRENDNKRQVNRKIVWQIFGKCKTGDLYYNEDWAGSNCANILPGLKDCKFSRKY